MKSFSIALLLLGTIWPTPSEAEEAATDSASTTSPAEAVIRANAEAYCEAFNWRDSQSLAAMWSPEGVYMDPETGEGISGQEAIAAQYAYEFAGSEDAKLSVEIDSIEFLSPNVAVETGLATLTYTEHDPEVFTYSAVHVRHQGKWLLDRISETVVLPPPPSNYKHLEKLEWMIGTWVDDDQAMTVRTECAWAKNRNFMTRSFTVSRNENISLSGMQIVGWDAVNEQICSWVFDSDGGFGEAVWKQDDDRWLIRTTGHLPTGQKSSGLNIITMIDDDSYTWQSVNRQVDGQLLPNVDEVLIVREGDADRDSFEREEHEAEDAETIAE